MIFLTTLPNATKAAKRYTKRWKIECLFRHLKANSDNLEDLNLKDPNKNMLIMAIITTAYILAVRDGWKRKKTYPNPAVHRWIRVARMFFFREGLSILTAKYYRFIKFLKYVFKAFAKKIMRLSKISSSVVLT